MGASFRALLDAIILYTACPCRFPAGIPPLKEYRIFPSEILKETVGPLFRTLAQLSPAQIIEALRAAGASAEITTAADSQGEGRFMGRVRAV